MEAIWRCVKWKKAFRRSRRFPRAKRLMSNLIAMHGSVLVDIRAKRSLQLIMHISWHKQITCNFYESSSVGFLRRLCITRRYICSAEWKIKCSETHLKIYEIAIKKKQRKKIDLNTTLQCPVNTLLIRRLYEMLFFFPFWANQWRFIRQIVFKKIISVKKNFDSTYHQQMGQKWLNFGWTYDKQWIDFKKKCVSSRWICF